MSVIALTLETYQLLHDGRVSNPVNFSGIKPVVNIFCWVLVLQCMMTISILLHTSHAVLYNYFIGTLKTVNTGNLLNESKTEYRQFEMNGVKGLFNELIQPSTAISLPSNQLKPAK